MVWIKKQCGQNDIFFLILRWWYIGWTWALRFNMSSLQLGSWTLVGLITWYVFNYFLLNYIITKIDANKMKHQHNVETFVWDIDSP
jgi:hypothetical protein